MPQVSPNLNLAQCLHSSHALCCPWQGCSCLIPLSIFRAFHPVWLHKFIHSFNNQHWPISCWVLSSLPCPISICFPWIPFYSQNKLLQSGICIWYLAIWKHWNDWLNFSVSVQILRTLKDLPIPSSLSPCHSHQPPINTASAPGHGQTSLFLLSCYWFLPLENSHSTLGFHKGDSCICWQTGWSDHQSYFKCYSSVPLWFQEDSTS
jgi:hypothetical protein